MIISFLQEETWEAKLGDCDPDDRGSIEIWHVAFPDNHAVYLYDREDRAQLISAAPDMARLLIEYLEEGSMDPDAVARALRKAGVR